MAEQYDPQEYYGQIFGDLNTRIRDLEEKQRLLKDKMVLISETFIKEREKNFNEIIEMKKVVEEVKGENERLKELVKEVERLETRIAVKDAEIDLLRAMIKGLSQPPIFKTE